MCCSNLIYPLSLTQSVVTAAAAADAGLSLSKIFDSAPILHGSAKFCDDRQVAKF